MPDEGRLVLATNGDGHSIVSVNGTCVWEGPNGHVYTFAEASGMLGAAAVLGLVVLAGYAIYSEASAGCGSGAVNSMIASFTLDAITNDVQGACATIRTMLDCMMMGGDPGTPEY